MQAIWRFSHCVTVQLQKSPNDLGFYLKRKKNPSSSVGPQLFFSEDEQGWLNKLWQREKKLNAQYTVKIMDWQMAIAYGCFRSAEQSSALL